MVEVVFSDSEKATVKIAKYYNAEALQHGVIGYFGKKPVKADLQTRYAGQPIGGSPQDVVNIGFALDFGDISGPFPGDGRREAVRQLWGRFGFDAKSYEQFFQTLCDDADKLLNAARDGMPIRAWVSHAPYSLCGFYALCDLLADIDCPLSSIFLPDFVPRDGQGQTRGSYTFWGEVESGKLYQFLPYERQVPEPERRSYAKVWRELKNENAPMRAIINGRLLSVPEDFYDFLLFRSIPDGDFVLAKLIGDLLNKYRLGISDSVYALRIDKLISEGKLLVVGNSDQSHPYGMILRKNL